MNEGEKTNTPTPSGGNFEAPQSGRPRANFVGSRRYRGLSEEDRYTAATNLANDPNTPEFFSNAVMANTSAPQPKRSRKWLIVGIIAFVVIIGGIIAAIALSGNRVASRSGAKNISEAFNLFGNYMLNGTESTDPLPESVDQNSYTSYRIGYIDSSDSAEEKAQYYSKLYEYYEDLKAYYDEADKERYDDAIVSDESIKYLGDVVDFLWHVDEYDQKTNNDIYIYYNNNGNESTERFINNIYNSYVNSDNTVLREYFSLKRSASDKMRELAKFVEDAGCAQAEKIEKCLVDKKKKYYSDALAIRSEILAYQSSMNDYRDNIVSLVLIRTIEMSNAIKQAENSDA